MADGGGGGRLFKACYPFLPSGWALIRGWALSRINKVSVGINGRPKIVV